MWGGGLQAPTGREVGLAVVAVLANDLISRHFAHNSAPLTAIGNPLCLGLLLSTAACFWRENSVLSV